MPDIDKNIVITPNRGATLQPNIVFTGQGVDPITVRVLDGTTGTGITAGGALSFEGSAGQLFSVVNRLGTGSIFSVNDISGIPSIDVDANGRIHMAAFTGFVGVGLTAPSQKLHVSGNALITGDIALNGGTLSTTSTTANLFNTTATTLNIGGAATTTNIANFAGGLTLDIANSLNASGTKRINIAAISPVGGGTQILNIGAGSGRISSSPSGISLGSDSIQGFVNILSASNIIGSINGLNSVLSVRAVGVSGAGSTFSNYVVFNAGLCASGISSGAYILTSSGIKALTGTTYTFLESDNGDVLTHDNASGCTLTIPTGLPVGFSTTVIRLNTNGTVRFIPASGVTLNSYLGLTSMAGQHASASLISYATNVFNLGGALA